MHPVTMNEEGVLQIKPCGGHIHQTALDVLQFVQTLKLVFLSRLGKQQ